MGKEWKREEREGKRKGKNGVYKKWLTRREISKLRKNGEYNDDFYRFPNKK